MTISHICAFTKYFRFMVSKIGELREYILWTYDQGLQCTCNFVSLYVRKGKNREVQQHRYHSVEARIYLSLLNAQVASRLLALLF